MEAGPQLAASPSKFNEYDVRDFLKVERIISLNLSFANKCMFIKAVIL